jgi:hypothetical protein
MIRPRLHDRFALSAEAAIRREGGSPFAGHLINLSKTGLAMFSAGSLPPGKLVSTELVLPVQGGKSRRMTLFGLTRWTKVLPEGNMLGIELMAHDNAGDYRSFRQWLAAHAGWLHLVN